MKTKQFFIVCTVALCLFSMQAQAATLDLASASSYSSRTGWTFANNKITFTTAANGNEYTITGSSSTVSIAFATGVNTTINLDGVTINSTTSPIDIQGTASVTINLVDGSTNLLVAANYYAGIEVANAASVIIAGNTGILNVQSNSSGAAIGGHSGSGGGDITITGGIIDATCIGSYGAGIGGGDSPGSSHAHRTATTTISGGTVVARGGVDAAGIGGADMSEAGPIVITGNAKVIAIGGNVRYSEAGAGIGPGGSGTPGSITIASTATVLAYSYGIYPAIYADASGNQGTGFYVNGIFQTADVGASEWYIDAFTAGTLTAPVANLTVPANYRGVAFTTGQTATSNYNLYKVATPNGEKQKVAVLNADPTNSAIPSQQDQAATPLTFSEALSVSDIIPNEGAISGGNTVTITGQNFMPQVDYTDGSSGAQYIQLEYLNFTGTQYINTGVKNNGVIDAEVDFNFASSGPIMIIFGAVQSDPSFWANAFVYARQMFIYNITSGSTCWQNVPTVTTNNNVRHTFSKIGNTAQIDGVTATSNVGTMALTGTQDFYVGTLNFKGDLNVVAENFQGNIYSLKFWCNGVLVRHFVPVFNVATGEKGLFDIVNNKFYGSDGGAFDNAYSITFDGTVATDIVVVNNTTLTAKVPAHAVGTVDVAVSLGSERDTLKQSYTYLPDTITVSPRDTFKIYGTADPAAIPYTLTDKGGHDITGATVGNFGRAPGNNVGEYRLTFNLADWTFADHVFKFDTAGVRFTIVKDTVTVTPRDTFKIYGTNDPVLPYNKTDKGGHTVTFSGALQRAAGDNVGTYAINAGNLSVDANHHLIVNLSAPKNLTINQAAGTASVTLNSWVYGSPNPLSATSGTNTGVTPTYTYVGRGSTSYGPIATRPTNVGTYTVTATFAATTNYTAVSASADFEITQATLTVKAADTSKVYGNANPTFRLIYSGFVNGDNASSVNPKPTATTTAVPTSPVGTYSITVSGGAAANYDLSYPTPLGTLTIVQAKRAFKDSTVNVTYSAGLTLGAIPLTNHYAWITASTTLTVADSGTMFPAKYIDPAGNYYDTTSTIKVNISKAAAGWVDTTINVTYSPGLMLASLLPAGSKYAWANPNTNLSAGSGQSFAATYTASSNHATVAGNITVNVNQAAGTASVTLADWVYGSPNTPNTPTATTNTGVTPTYTYAGRGSTNYGTTATQPTNVGTYTVTATFAATTNYTAVSVSADFEITKATLTVSTPNVSCAQGHIPATFAVNYTGFKNGETATVISTPSTASTTATADSSPGNYLITLSKTDVADNYTFTYTNGLLTVTDKILVAVVWTDTLWVYNGAAQQPTATVTIGTTKSLTVSGAQTNVGDYTATAALDAADESGYALSNPTHSFKIVPDTITVSADNKSKVYGSPDPTLTYIYSPTKTPAPPFAGVLTRASGDNVQAGGYAITQGTLAAGSNYHIKTFTQGTLTIHQAAGSFTHADLYVTYTPGLKLSDVALSGTNYVWNNEQFLSVTDSGSTYSATYTDPSGNYAVATGLVKVHISKAPGIASVSLADWTYGTPKAPVPVSATNGTASVTYMYDNINGGTYHSSTQPKNAGTYKVTATFAASANYQQTEAADTFTISKKMLTVKADDKTKTQGAPNPPLTVTYSDFDYNDNPFEYNDTPDSLTAQPTLTTTAVKESTANDYDIFVSGGLSNNYTFTYNYGILTINPPHNGQVAWSDTTFVYDGNPHVPTATVTINGVVIPLAVDTAQTEVGTYTAYAYFSPANDTTTLSGDTVQFSITPQDLIVVEDTTALSDTDTLLVFNDYAVVKLGYNAIFLHLRKLRENIGFRPLKCEWYKDGKLLDSGFVYSAGPTRQHKIKPGNYTFKLIGDSAVYYSTEQYLEVKFKSALSIYPNPVSNEQLHIGNVRMLTLENATNSPTVEIYDINGVLVLELPLLPLTSGNTATIDVSRLRAGVYFVKVGENISKVVVK